MKNIAFYTPVLIYAISNDALTSGRARGSAGIVLTIFTIVSSILRPYERCVSAGATLVALSNWKTDLLRKRLRNTVWPR